jgi:hypothetical protein
VEFYIEGSGSYAISNLDLLSHEIYFTKRDTLAQLDPSLFLCYQTDYSESSALLREALQALLEELNPRSRLPLTLEEPHRSGGEPLRRNSPAMRKLRQSLLFIADGTAIAQLPGPPAVAVPSPEVCVEMGYALGSKRPEQILLVQQTRSGIVGHFPFEVPAAQRLVFANEAELRSQLGPMVTAQLQRYSLF